MQVPDEIRIAGDKPLFNHRSPQMFDLVSRLEAGCRPLFGTSSDVIFLSASGSGTMESAIVNLTSPGDEVLVAVGGSLCRSVDAYRESIRFDGADDRSGLAHWRFRSAGETRLGAMARSEGSFSDLE